MFIIANASKSFASCRNAKARNAISSYQGTLTRDFQKFATTRKKTGFKHQHVQGVSKKVRQFKNVKKLLFRQKFSITSQPLCILESSDLSKSKKNQKINVEWIV